MPEADDLFRGTTGATALSDDAVARNLLITITQVRAETEKRVRLEILNQQALVAMLLAVLLLPAGTVILTLFEFLSGWSLSGSVPPAAVFGIPLIVVGVAMTAGWSILRWRIRRAALSPPVTSGSGEVEGAPLQLALSELSILDWHTKSLRERAETTIIVVAVVAVLAGGFAGAIADLAWPSLDGAGQLILDCVFGAIAIGFSVVYWTQTKRRTRLLEDRAKGYSQAIAELERQFWDRFDAGVSAGKA